VKRIFHYLPVPVAAFSIPLAHAQYGFDVGVGFGTMQDKASGNASITTKSCLVHSRFGRPSCVATSSLSGFSMGVSAMSWPGNISESAAKSIFSLASRITRAPIECRSQLPVAHDPV